MIVFAAGFNLADGTLQGPQFAFNERLRQRRVGLAKVIDQGRTCAGVEHTMGVVRLMSRAAIALLIKE